MNTDVTAQIRWITQATNTSFKVLRRYWRHTKAFVHIACIERNYSARRQEQEKHICFEIAQCKWANIFMNFAIPFFYDCEGGITNASTHIHHTHDQKAMKGVNFTAYFVGLRLLRCWQSIVVRVESIVWCSKCPLLWLIILFIAHTILYIFIHMYVK